MATSNNIESVEPVVSNNTEFIEPGLNSYELRWNDHIPYFTKVFQSLRDLNELTDVTFACEDGIVCAHKLVLSSCSAYLRILFARLGTPNPVIFLKNTPVSLVRHVLEFIYCGSVNVSKEELALVLNLGHSLQIRGLAKLKLSRENESGGDKRVYELEKERKRLEQQLSSEHQRLPGDVTKSPAYSLHHGKNMELVSDNNGNICKEKINRKPGRPSAKEKEEEKKIISDNNGNICKKKVTKKSNASSSIVQEKIEENKIISDNNGNICKEKINKKSKACSPVIKEKVKEKKIIKETQNKINIQEKVKEKKIKETKNKKTKLQKSQKKVLKGTRSQVNTRVRNTQKQNVKSITKLKKSCQGTQPKIKQNKVDQVKGTKIKQVTVSANCGKSATKKKLSKVEKSDTLKPQSKGKPRYDPLLKKKIGKYFVEHGYSEAQKYFKKNLGFEPNNSILYKMKLAYLNGKKGKIGC